MRQAARRWEPWSLVLVRDHLGRPVPEWLVTAAGQAVEGMDERRAVVPVQGAPTLVALVRGGSEGALAWVGQLASHEPAAGDAAVLAWVTVAVDETGALTAIPSADKWYSLASAESPTPEGVWR